MECRRSATPTLRCLGLLRSRLKAFEPGTLNPYFLAKMANPVLINYSGPSMNPTLKAGDILSVMPYEGSETRIGDVVVFQPPDEQHYVVHRVAAFDLGGGIKTRGDNNSHADSYVLSMDSIIGQVVSIKRGREEIHVCGGRKGRIYANIRWAAKLLDRLASKILHPAYHYLARKGIFRKVLSPFVKPRLLRFQRTHGVEMQILLGRWVVGRRLAGQNHWRIRRPFKLFIDEALLSEDDSI